MRSRCLHLRGLRVPQLHYHHANQTLPLSSSSMWTLVARNDFLLESLRLKTTSISRSRRRSRIHDDDENKNASALTVATVDANRESSSEKKENKKSSSSPCPPCRFVSMPTQQEVLRRCSERAMEQYADFDFQIYPEGHLEKTKRGAAGAGYHVRQQKFTDRNDDGSGSEAGTLEGSASVPEARSLEDVQQVACRLALKAVQKLKPSGKKIVIGWDCRTGGKKIQTALAKEGQVAVVADGSGGLVQTIRGLQKYGNQVVFQPIFTGCGFTANLRAATLAEKAAAADQQEEQKQDKDKMPLEVHVGQYNITNNSQEGSVSYIVKRPGGAHTPLLEASMTRNGDTISVAAAALRALRKAITTKPSGPRDDDGGHHKNKIYSPSQVVFYGTKGELRLLTENQENGRVTSSSSSPQSRVSREVEKLKSRGKCGVKFSLYDSVAKDDPGFKWKLHCNTLAADFCRAQRSSTDSTGDGDRPSHSRSSSRGKEGEDVVNGAVGNTEGGRGSKSPSSNKSTSSPSDTLEIHIGEAPGKENSRGAVNGGRSAYVVKGAGEASSIIEWTGLRPHLGGGGDSGGSKLMSLVFALESLLAKGREGSMLVKSRQIIIYGTKSEIRAFETKQPQEDRGSPEWQLSCAIGKLRAQGKSSVRFSPYPTLSKEDPIFQWKLHCNARAREGVSCTDQARTTGANRKNDETAGLPKSLPTSVDLEVYFCAWHVKEATCQEDVNNQADSPSSASSTTSKATISFIIKKGGSQDRTPLLEDVKNVNAVAGTRATALAVALHSMLKSLAPEGKAIRVHTDDELRTSGILDKKEEDGDGESSMKKARLAIHAVLAHLQKKNNTVTFVTAAEMPGHVVPRKQCLKLARSGTGVVEKKEATSEGQAGSSSV